MRTDRTVRWKLDRMTTAVIETAAARFAAAAAAAAGIASRVQRCALHARCEEGVSALTPVARDHLCVLETRQYRVRWLATLLRPFSSRTRRK